jgi:hypothetical protein
MSSNNGNVEFSAKTMPFYTDKGIEDARVFFGSMPVSNVTVNPTVANNGSGGGTQQIVKNLQSKIDITTWIIIVISLITIVISVFFYLDNRRIDPTGIIDIYQIIHDNTHS